MEANSQTNTYSTMGKDTRLDIDEMCAQAEGGGVVVEGWAEGKSVARCDLEYTSPGEVKMARPLRQGGRPRLSAFTSAELVFMTLFPYNREITTRFKQMLKL